MTAAVTFLADVDTAAIREWVSAIDLAEWPQQNRLEDGQIRPAMVSDPSWHGFAAVAEPLVRECLQHFPGCVAYRPMLSVVMPGHSIPPHVDRQKETWVCRVHVPLLTNERALFIADEVSYQMEASKAYRVDTQRTHAVVNDGSTPRIHLMFDVGRGP